MTVGYQMPVFLSALGKKHMPIPMRGFICGLIALPADLALGGLLLDITIGQWIVNTVPVLILCSALALAFLATSDITIRTLSVLGMALQMLSYILFALVVIGIVLSKYAIANRVLVEEDGVHRA